MATAQHRTCLDIRIDGEAWMNIANPKLSVEDAVAVLRSLGNTIVEVDEAGRRIKCMQVSEYPYKDIFICERCGAYSVREAVTIAHEAECNGIPGVPK